MQEAPEAARQQREAAVAAKEQADEKTKRLAGEPQRADEKNVRHPLSPPSHQQQSQRTRTSSDPEILRAAEISRGFEAMSVSEAEFLRAAHNGDIGTVNRAIDQRVNVNCTDVSGR